MNVDVCSKHNTECGDAQRGPRDRTLPYPLD